MKIRRKNWENIKDKTYNEKNWKAQPEEQILREKTQRKGMKMYLHGTRSNSILIVFLS